MNSMQGAEAIDTLTGQQRNGQRPREGGIDRKKDLQIGCHVRRPAKPPRVFVYFQFIAHVSVEQLKHTRQSLYLANSDKTAVDNQEKVQVQAKARCQWQMESSERRLRSPKRQT